MSKVAPKGYYRRWVVEFPPDEGALGGGIKIDSEELGETITVDGPIRVIRSLDPITWEQIIKAFPYLQPFGLSKVSDSLRDLGIDVADDPGLVAWRNLKQ